MYNQHIPRDQNLDSNGSTPFQQHQSLGHALGNHPHIAATYARAQPEYRHPSTSPPTLNQPTGAPSAVQQHQQPMAAYPQAAVNGQTSPALKRKQMDSNQINVPMNKRRRDDDDSFDMGEGGQGAKHWTDEEKTRLFSWLMGPSNTEHWNALRATKNSCLRECANEIFDGKKSYQALKGCYERNFNVFKQIYACESLNQQRGACPSASEAERLREYERRLQHARKNNADIGNITARNLEHWYSRGWYRLFFDRWHGDPATTKPVVTGTRAPASVNVHSGGGPEDGDDGEDPSAAQAPNSSSTLEFPQADPTLLTSALSNGLSHDRPPPPQQHSHHVFINPQSLGPGPSGASRPEVRHIHGPPQQHTPQQQHAIPHPLPQHPQHLSHPQANGATGHGPVLSSPSTLHPSIPQHPPPPPMAGIHSPHPPPSTLNHHPSHHPTTGTAAAATAHTASGPGHTVNGSSSNTSLASGDTSGGAGAAAGMPLSFLTPQMVNTFMQYCQAQTHASKMKMEYLRRREEREEKEHRAKLESEQLRLEKDRYELDQLKATSVSKLKTEKAFELLGRNDIDPIVQKAASEYVRKILQEEL